MTSTGVNHADKQNATGRSCVKCKVCEAKCPQHIGISEELVGVTRRMEPFWFRPAVWALHKIMG